MARRELLEYLRKIIEFEEKICPRDNFCREFGWEVSDVGVPPWVIPTLMNYGLLRRVGKGVFKLVDIEKAKRFLESQNFEERSVEFVCDLSSIDKSIFDDVVGYDDVKELIIRALRSDFEFKTHFLLVGPPASAKTLFLLCLERLPCSKFVDGSRVTLAGLSDLIATFKPRILLIDELDKMDRKAMYLLLNVMDTQRLVVTVSGKFCDIKLNVNVFATANELSRIPNELRSRFMVLKFKEYDRDEFVKVVKHILARRGVGEDLAEYIATKVWEEFPSKDVRHALRIASLAKSRSDVDWVINVVKKYT